MSGFYHEFTPQVWCHIYPYVAIVTAVVMIILGARQHRLVWSNKKWRWRICQRYGEELHATVAVIATFVIIVLVFLESSDGINQMILNDVGPYEDPTIRTAVLGGLLPLAMLAVGSIFFYCLAFATEAIVFRRLVLKWQELNKKGIFPEYANSQKCGMRTWEQHFRK